MLGVAAAQLWHGEASGLGSLLPGPDGSTLKMRRWVSKVEILENQMPQHNGEAWGRPRPHPKVTCAKKNIGR